MDYAKVALEKHLQWKGKIEIVPTCPVETKEDLSVAYTPGVAAPCIPISKDVNDAYEYCRKSAKHFSAPIYRRGCPHVHCPLYGQQ